MPTTIRTFTPSPAQDKFIRQLITERAWLYTELGQTDDAAAVTGYLDTFYTPSEVRDARTTIDRMIATNKDLRARLRKITVPTVAAAADEKVGEGLYHLDGKNYRVTPNKAGTRFYAKEVVNTPKTDDYGTRVFKDGKPVFKTHFEYRPGVIFKLTPAHKMTKEQAKAHGAYAGTCVRCGRTLTREDSIDRMVGKHCAGLMGW